MNTVSGTAITAGLTGGNRYLKSFILFLRLSISSEGKQEEIWICDFGIRNSEWQGKRKKEKGESEAYNHPRNELSPGDAYGTVYPVNSGAVY